MILVLLRYSLSHQASYLSVVTVVISHETPDGGQRQWSLLTCRILQCELTTDRGQQIVVKHQIWSFCNGLECGYEVILLSEWKCVWESFDMTVFPGDGFTDGLLSVVNDG